MFLYAVLAYGGVLSYDTQQRGLHRLFSEIAADAINARRGRLSIQLVQSQVLLALYHGVLDEESLSRHFSGNALQAALGLGLHLEPSLIEDVKLYGMKGNEVSECYRRTFWSVYMVEVCTFSPLTATHIY